jgi:ribosomal-protein-alanine N-acetyltransferase
MRSSADLVLRKARSADRSEVAGLLSRAHWRHFHLDWATHSTSSRRASLLAFHGDRLVAHFLHGSIGQPGFAALRRCEVEHRWPFGDLWARPPPPALPCRSAASPRCSRENGAKPLLGGGLPRSNAVVFFEWRGGRLEPRPSALGQLRSLQQADLPAVVGVDERAFAPLWRNSLESLSAAMSQAIVATGVEVDGRLVAYQLTMASPFGAHLARLAVDPDQQRRGLATGIVVDLIQHLGRRGFDSVTLNTQADNLRSQDLYRGLGFRETGQRYPVFETTLVPEVG